MMKTQTFWQDKRIWYALAVTIITGLMVFLSQNVTAVLSIGVTQGLSELAAVLTVENLASSGELILWTMISAVGWRLGGALIFAIILFIAGAIIY